MLVVPVLGAAAGIRPEEERILQEGASLALLVLPSQ
jgi:hypothetical protein